MNARSSTLRSDRPGGFTLVEMLVVIAIIAGLLAMAGSMLGGGDAGDATRMAAKELRAMVEQAQSRAVASGNQTAVLIYKKWGTATTANNDRFLRFVIVAERVPTATNPSVYEWLPIGNGSYLSNGAYYWPKDGVGFKEAFAGDGTMRFGAAFPSNAKADWYGIIFTPQGIPVGPGPLSENPKFLLAAGLTSSAGLEVNEKEKLLTEGFMIQRSNGRVIAIESPAQQLTL